MIHRDRLLVLDPRARTALLRRLLAVVVHEVERDLARLLAGSSSNRLVTLTPVPGQVGTANVTLTVSDGSSTASTTFQVTVNELSSQLSLTKNGQGTVTPDLNNTTLVIGKSYTVTAKPATGYEFGGWTGSIVSSSPTLTPLSILARCSRCQASSP